MSWRLFAVGAFIFGAAFYDSFLLYDEEIVPPDAKTQKEQRQNDAHFEMRFNVPEREKNMLAMGFDQAQTKAILTRMGELEEKYRVKDPERNQIVAKIEATEDVDALTEGFCGTGTTLPVRYSAMPFLLEERDGKLKTVDVDVISSFKYNEWAKAARISAAYEEADRTKDRKDDASRMVMAGILARAEEQIIAHKSPWGGGFISGWSWDDLKKKYPGTEEHLINYVALLHLVLEYTTAEGGLCTT